jgi:tetratricopeptide (TPR) repeat protein/tRNA A-37 threonylcarbamoyl transferase component Bud32
MNVKKVGRYELKSSIGRGGMATVYLGHDPRFRRAVAVKVMHDSLADPVMLLRFEREAQTIAALEHPAIVPVYDYGEEDGRPYLVMRYMSGGTLADRLGSGPLPVAEVVPVLERIGSALERAHALGIIHRDLKPSNIMFDQYGDAFLGDFGIARLTAAAVTLTGEAVIGTPAYMSPEQVHGDRTLDGRSDIYALGVIVFEMLAGRQPYVDETPVKVMMKHVMDPVPTVRSLNPELPPAFDALIARTMAKDPGERFATAREVVQAVTAAAAQMAATQTATTPAETGQTATPATAPPAAGEQATVAQVPTFVAGPAPGPALVASRRIPLLWPALLVLLFVAGGAVLAYRARAARPLPLAARSEETPVGNDVAGATTTAAKSAVPATTGQAFVALAQNHMDHGATEAALDALNQAIALEPENGDYYRFRAEFYWHNGDPEAALTDADQVVAYGPDDAANYLFRAELWRDYGDLNQALRDQAKALELEPEWAEAYHERGLTYLWQGAYGAALADLDRAIALAADNGDHFLLRGLVQRERNQLRAAIADHLKAVALEPDNAYFQAELAISYDWAGDLRQAVATVSEAIRLEPEAAWYYDLRGAWRRTLGDLDGSLADYNQAIRLEPESAALFAGRALTRRALDDPEAALADLDRAVAMAPEEAWFYLERGLVYRDSVGDLVAAQADFIQAIELAPEEPFAFLHLAAIMHRLDRLEEAVDLAGQCIEVAPDNPWCYSERAWAYAALDRPALAVADFKRFLELVPADECPECQSDARRFIADHQ